MRRLVVLFTALFALRAAEAQDAVRTISPGMTRAQVVERLGQPATSSQRGEFTYLFYLNGCRTCGMDDLVVLHNDAVVDAIFRAPTRRYTGTSSSPASTTPSPSADGERRGSLVVGEPSGGGAPRASTPAPARGAAPARSATAPTATDAPAPRSAPPSATDAPAPPAPGQRAAPGAAAPASPADTPPRDGPRGDTVFPVVPAPGGTGLRPAAPPPDTGFTEQKAPVTGLPARDSAMTPTVAVPRGGSPVPFQGSKPAPADSARAAAAASRPPADTARKPL